MRLAIPAGRLEELSVAWLRQQGIMGEARRGRTLMFQASPDLEMVVMRGRDIPNLLTAGAVDVAILGRDVALDCGVDLWMGESLGFGHSRLMLALPTGAEWDASRPWRIASRYGLVTARWAESLGVQVDVVPLAGSVEAAPRLGLADAVVDVVETGRTLRANGLEPRLVVLESWAVLATRLGEAACAEALLGACGVEEQEVSRVVGKA